MIIKLLDNCKKSYIAWINLIKFKKLNINNKLLVFYVEDSSDWTHLNPIINYIEKNQVNYLRITSDTKDSYINNKNTFFIGFGSARTYFFKTLESKALIMTLADLNTFHIKKSLNPVHYFYVFHSIVSTHRVYREHAFNNYDTIFCVGNHHIAEIIETEKIYNLNKKILVKHGYGRLDYLINEINKNNIKKNKNNIQPHILLAPSWGQSSIVNGHIEQIIEILLLNNFKITLRLHPMTQRKNPNLSKKLIKKYKNSNKFFYDYDIGSINSLIESDLMISEWSGAAIEFAFCRERPVIFIDTPAKINNLNWKKINLPCLEENIREKIGKIVKLNELENISLTINNTLNEIDLWTKKIIKIRNETIFNIGNSGTIAGEIIRKKLSE